MSDASVIAIVGSITGLISAAISGYFGYKIKQTADTTLQHVNHERIAQAQRYATSCRLSADLSGPSGNDAYKKLAEIAEAELNALIKAQAQIDRGGKA